MTQQPGETATTADDSYYSAATDLSRSNVENYAVRVRQLFLEHNWSAISSEISYPITISDTIYNNSADFIDVSDSFESGLEEDFFQPFTGTKNNCCQWDA